MIKMPNSNGFTKIYNEPIYIEERINNIPFNYYKVIGQLASGYYMGTVVHFESDTSFPFIGKFSALPNYFTDVKELSYKEVNYEIYQAAFDQVLEEL